MERVSDLLARYDPDMLLQLPEESMTEEFFQELVFKYKQTNAFYVECNLKEIKCVLLQEGKSLATIELDGMELEVCQLSNGKHFIKLI